MRAFLIFLLALMASAGGWYLGAKYGKPMLPVENSDDQPPASTNGPPIQTTIHGQGKFEPAGGLINIVGPPGERIAELIDKKVGDVVGVDEVLVTLQSRLLREKDLELAKARRADALSNLNFEKEQGGFNRQSAQLALAEAKSSEEKISGEARKIQLLESQQAAARKLLKRLQSLYSNPSTKDLVNQTEIDKQELLVEQLELQIQQSNLEIELARKSSVRAEKVAQNNLQTVEYSIEHANDAVPLKSLDAAVALAQQAYDLTQLHSPIENATILDIIVAQGDSITNRPIMVLGDTSKMVCVVEVVDTYLGRIDLEKHQNLRARITDTALPKPLMGTVIARGIMIGPVSLKDPNPFASVDQRTGTLTIELDDSDVAAKFVNLQVDVEIEVEPGTLK